MRQTYLSSQKTALVTGASSGIGEAFARSLAARGIAVLLSALPEERGRLEAIADELSRRHQVRAEVAAINLEERDAARRLQAAADELEFEPDILVNSAGIGAGGAFSDAALDRHVAMIHVNVEALVALTGLYVPRMVARRRGAVVNVASTAAFTPIPYFSVYAASKAFVLSFTEGLWAECHRRGVRVVAICPGPVASRFHEAAGDTEPPRGIRRLIKRRYMTPDHIAARALDALERDQPTSIQRAPGFGIVALPLGLAALAPRRLRLMASERLSRWYFQQL